MHRIALRPPRVRPMMTFLTLAAGLTLFGGAVTTRPAMAQSGDTGHATATQNETSEDFAAEFDRRFRDGDQTGASTESAQSEHRAYDPYYDDEDENGSDHAGSARQTGSDDSQAMSGQQSAEHERDADPERSGAADDSRGQSTDRARDASRERGPARACNERTGRRIGRMLDRMERLTRPAGEQQQAFEKLRDAANRAIEMARAACPTERPITPSGRLAAAEKRLEILLEAIRTVRPALDDFYKTLSEEQKAHFYAASPARQSEQWREHARRSLGDGRLDAWRDEMRRRWRDRWSDDDGMRPRGGMPHDRMFRDDHRQGYHEGRPDDGAHEWHRSERRDNSRSRSRDDDDEDSADSWNL
jgi:hypothetical protein